MFQLSLYVIDKIRYDYYTQLYPPKSKLLKLSNNIRRRDIHNINNDAQGTICNSIVL